VYDPEQSTINSRRALERITRAIYKIEGLEIKERTLVAADLQSAATKQEDLQSEKNNKR
jgi:hypothetical protein